MVRSSSRPRTRRVRSSCATARDRGRRRRRRPCWLARRARSRSRPAGARPRTRPSVVLAAWSTVAAPAAMGDDERCVFCSQEAARAHAHRLTPGKTMTAIEVAGHTRRNVRGGALRAASHRVFASMKHIAEGAPRLAAASWRAIDRHTWLCRSSAFASRRQAKQTARRFGVRSRRRRAPGWSRPSSVTRAAFDGSSARPLMHPPSSSARRRAPSRAASSGSRSMPQKSPPSWCHGRSVPAARSGLVHDHRAVERDLARQHRARQPFGRAGSSSTRKKRGRELELLDLCGSRGLGRTTSLCRT